jgi:hypothetical protein
LCHCAQVCSRGQSVVVETACHMSLFPLNP